MKHLVLALALLAGCARNETAGPAPIDLGEDTCDLCRMIISEAPHAAQLRSGSGKVEKFDDIGCLGERLSGGAAATQVWVVNKASGAWIDGRSASYVHSADYKTPMASGLAAFAARAEAEAFSKANNGKLMTFEEVVSMRRPR